MTEYAISPQVSWYAIAQGQLYKPTNRCVYRIDADFIRPAFGRCSSPEPCGMALRDQNNDTTKIREQHSAHDRVHHNLQIPGILDP